MSTPRTRQILTAQVARARRLRAELIAYLGGRCAHRGCRRTDQLEFDHIHGRDWDPRSKSRWTRMAIYRREAAEGKLQLLCRTHNAIKGRPAPAAPSWVTNDE